MNAALVHAEWANRVAAEYRSAALTAQLAHAWLRAGLDDAIARTALRIVSDELDHAALAHRCLIDLGGGDAPIPVAPAGLAHAAPDVLTELIDLVGRNFCLGETFAVPLFAAMRSGTTHPAVRPTLDRILRDEAIHRQFGWDALDALRAVEPDRVCAHLTAALPSWIAAFRDAYAPMAAGLPVGDAERAVGLLPLAAYRDAFEACLRDDVAPRFLRRGIAIAAVDQSETATSGMPCSNA